MKVLFAGGGTLGHIFPCFSVIEKLKKEGNKVYFISGIKENERRIEKENEKELREKWKEKNFLKN